MYQDHYSAMRDFAADHNEDPGGRGSLDDDYGRPGADDEFGPVLIPSTGGTSGFGAEHGPGPRDEEVHNGTDVA